MASSKRKSLGQINYEGYMRFAFKQMGERDVNLFRPWDDLDQDQQKRWSAGAVSVQRQDRQRQDRQRQKRDARSR